MPTTSRSEKRLCAGSLKHDGSLDAGFSGGTVTTDFQDTADQGYGSSSSDDRCAGRIYNYPGRGVTTPNAPEGDSETDFALARYNADGSLDDGTANDSTPGDSFAATALCDGL